MRGGQHATQLQLTCVAEPLRDKCCHGPRQSAVGWSSKIQVKAAHAVVSDACSYSTSASSCSVAHSSCRRSSSSSMSCSCCSAATHNCQHSTAGEVHNTSTGLLIACTLGSLGLVRPACAATDGSHGHGLMLAKLGGCRAKGVAGDLCHAQRKGRAWATVFFHVCRNIILLSCWILFVQSATDSCKVRGQ